MILDISNPIYPHLHIDCRPTGLHFYFLPCMTINVAAGCISSAGLHFYYKDYHADYYHFYIPCYASHVLHFFNMDIHVHAIFVH